MGLLLYKSNEMFSSTELIRKSKMVFDKVVNDEIEKAIILRDGKPSFLLMDFEKYEKIMAEFEELKAYVESLDDAPVKKTKPKKAKKTKEKTSNEKLKDDLVKEAQKISTKPRDYAQEIETKEPPAIVEEKVQEIKQEQVVEEEMETKDEELVSNIDDEQKQDVVEKVELTEEEEISNALKSIESMNFDDDMKKMAEDKIKEKILQARKERAEQLALQEEEEEEFEQEEQEIALQVEEEKVKKERELKEFWD